MQRHRTCLLALALSLGAQAAEVDRDDPGERAKVMRLLRGDPDPAGQWRVLLEAQIQRDRWGGRAPRTPSQRVQGGTFVSLGPDSADYQFNGARYDATDSGRARQIVAHPTDPGILYLATAGGGVWKTWDAGAHWEPITDTLGTTAVGALAMDPADPDVLYLGFGDPFDLLQPGLTKSSDGGATWADPVLLSNAGRIADTVTDIRVDPGNSSVVLAATDVGLFRSTDAGATWQLADLRDPSGNALFFIWSLAAVGPNTWLATGEVADPARPNSASQNTGAMGLWRSTDDGATWQWNSAALPGGDPLLATAGRGTFAVAPSTLIDPATTRVFLLVSALKGEQQLDLYRSDDAGQSFLSLGVNARSQPLNPTADQVDLNLGHGQSWYNQAITVDPNEPDLVFAGGDLALIRSSDGGNSWEVISDWLPGPQGINEPYIHADQHTIAVGADGTVYVGSDGGISVSSDARGAGASAVTFSSTQNRGLVTHLALTVACAPETWPAEMQGWVGGGMQDLGTRIRSGATTVFNQALGGDGIGLAVSGGTHADTVLGAAPDALLASTEFKLYRSTDGGQNWAGFIGGFGSAQLPFFVRVSRDRNAPDPQTFLTFTGSPPGVYLSTAGGAWQAISGILHWQNVGKDTTGFVTTDSTGISLRDIVAHPGHTGVYAAYSNKFAYVTADGGAHWLVSIQPAPEGAAAGTGVYLLSSIAFDPADPSGMSYYLTSRAMNLADPAGNIQPLPQSLGHLYKTTDGGLHWTSLGAQPVNAGGLPFVPALVIRPDPGDPATLYVGTALGLYRSTDSGATWSRFGAASLPLVEVSDVCISPASKRLTIATYGRGFWQIGTEIGTGAGVKGNGDTNFDQRIDGSDLIDLLDAFGTTQASSGYRWQADLVGAINAVDGDDLAALLAHFGGQP